jgi:DnaK suppressor protein
MKTKDLQAYKRTLEMQQRQLAPNRLDLEAIEIQRVADSVDDVALENERHVALEACSRKANLFVEVTEALGRIDVGAYGLCLDCGEPISVKRLSAMPWARLCLECQEKAERDPLAEMQYLAQGLTHAA